MTTNQTKPTAEEIRDAVRRHNFWLLDLEDGQKADFSEMDLSNAYLQGANLAGANFGGANLTDVDLSNANLERANLIETKLYGATFACANLRGAYLGDAKFTAAGMRPYADLHGADLAKANLHGAEGVGVNFHEAKLAGACLVRADFRNSDFYCANLSNTDLLGANLSYTNLQWTDLRGANLGDTDFTGATLPNFQLCPEGKFIGWKKVCIDSKGYILKLQILGDRSSSLIGRKCRTSKAKVLSAFDIGGSETTETVFSSMHDRNFKYTVGEIVTAEYDSDIRIECTSGIHFFMTRKEAAEY